MIYRLIDTGVDLVTGRESKSVIDSFENCMLYSMKKWCHMLELVKFKPSYD